MDFSEIEQKLKSIEQRLSLLEKSDNKPHAKKESVVIPSEIRPKIPTPANSSATTLSASLEKPGNWLGIIAVICFVLAAGFIIKLSIESGWLTPIRQLGLVVILGLSLIGAGFSLLKSDREYASFLPAAGIVALYLSAFASHRFYDLFSFEISLSAVTFVSGLCIWLYLKIEHNIYAFTAAVGSYVAPVVLGLNTDANFALFYFILCSIAFTTISVWLESRLLTLISAYLAILMTGWLGQNLNSDGLVVTFLALHFLIFAFGLYIYTILNKKPLTENESYLLMPVLLIFYATGYYFFNRFQPGLAPWISLVLAFVTLSLYLAARKKFPDQVLNSTPIIFSFITLVGLHSVYLELIPSDFRPWLFVIILGVFTFFPFNFSATKGTAFRIPILALGLIAVIEYISMVAKLITRPDSQNLPVVMTSFVLLWVVQIFKTERLKSVPEYALLILISSHLLAVLGCYQIFSSAGSLAVSASWLFYAIAVMCFAFFGKDKIMAKSALLVLALAAVKALLYDTSSAETIVRILCLLLTGLVLYVSGFLIRRISSWNS